MKGMLRVVVAEDDEIFRRQLIEFLKKIDGISVEYFTDDGKEALEALNKIKPEIAILDIELFRMSGIEVAKKVRETMPFLEIIFITSFEEYIKEAVKLYASDYIEKPLKEERLRETIERIKKRFLNIENYLPVPVKDNMRLINPREVYFVQAKKKRSVIYTGEEKIECDYSLKELEEILPGDIFFRTNRSYLVNILKVEALKEKNRTSFEITFKGCAFKAYLSKDLYQEFRKRVKEIYRN
ncbi:MAG: Response regulators of cell autolysi [Caldanaerobacter subterraneus]|jgi:two-component system LytT family response regulator|nr:MAG: Response regulators of cell autolysi [Caldanaerobacter subterraneus]